MITIDPFISDFSSWATSDPNNLAASDYLMRGLDYIIDNKELQRDFYRELSTAYSLRGNIIESEAFTNKAIELEKTP